MTNGDVYSALRVRYQDLRLRLSEWVGDSAAPEEGSDAAMLLEALCGAAPEVYLPRFEASARRLAENGGRLEVRLTYLQRWQEALATAISDLFGDDPPLMAQAQMLLGSLVTFITVTITREFQSVENRYVSEKGELARRSVTRLQALQRINAAANSTLDIDQTLVTTAQAVAEEMKADLCVIFLFDEITRELQLRATSGPYPRNGRHFTLELGRGYTGWVAEHGHPLLTSDASADPRFAQEAGAYATPYRGLLSVPIIFFTTVKLEGVISVQMRDPHTFGEDDVAFLEIVAGQLAMNIENGRLYEQTDEELRRKVHELSTLHRVSALVTSTLVLDNVLRIIVAQAVLLSGADRSVLFQLDPATQRLRAVASHGFDARDLAHSVVQVGQCCVGRVVRSSEPSMQVDCMRSDEGCFLHGLPKVIGDQHAVLCAPLTTVRGPLGALCVFSSQRHMLNAHQLQLVVTFANVAAIAMENARLFEQTRKGLRTKEVLLREMHHRVKNNLQQVASILNMQRRRAKMPEVEQVLMESVDRIQGIAATHDLLSNTQLGMAPVDEITRKIVGILRGNIVPPHLTVRFRIGSAPFLVPSEQATTLAIILNELISNAIEHGFENRERGEIRISGVQDDGHLRLRVADDGQGLPEGFNLQASDGLGMQLVRGLVQSNLRGSVEIFSTTGSPDLEGDGTARDVRITDPSIPVLNGVPSVAPGLSHDAGEVAEPGKRWTVVEVRFPVVLAAEATEQGAVDSVPLGAD
ncbi:MAG: GAF domain-containing protein [Ktedonobacterales bacterium]